ncbi:PhyH-domain-containing protein [Aspergillus sclerotiicarbonarius CBS 121057]|uniref:PhyH-domain-containing protein n=1 Tax=Aspergillus sclerotiicarbonarius (strain CBS 121057 / IBT 28362) TaxID=1448318 RepID=A0A319EHN5_ASPSB|nr:PhyH-domain-containing protein [Aspergillus sclerotiicarbonarius CBS 121057]
MGQMDVAERGSAWRIAGPCFARFDAADPLATTQTLVEAIRRDGGVIVENLITREAAEQIKSDLKPYFDKDIPDKYGLFPPTTKRATGLMGISDACVELACNPLYIGVANALVSSSYTFWRGDHRVTVTGKPIISSTAGFRITPGSRQQVLHRDDRLTIGSDYHPHSMELPVMIGCVTALTRTTKENGATIAIPGSHLWGPERQPLDEEAVPAELEAGDAFIFLGNLYHAGGANVTENNYRETVGIFLCKPTLRPVENQFLMVPLDQVRKMKPQAQRLLGYGVCEPGVGFMHYQDPMRVLFGVEDEETVDM